MAKGSYYRELRSIKFSEVQKEISVAFDNSTNSFSFKSNFGNHLKNWENSAISKVKDKIKIFKNYFLKAVVAKPVLCDKAREYLEQLPQIFFLVKTDMASNSICMQTVSCYKLFSEVGQV